MVESSNTEFGQPDDPQKGRSLDRDRQGSMPIAGPEMNRHLRRAGYARQIGELGDVDLETNPPTNGQTLVWDETVGGDPYNPENNSGPTGAWVPGGGKVLIEVRNESGTSIARNAAVYVSGEHTSGKPLIDLADASDNALMPAIGLAQDEILDNTEGYVIAAGNVEGLQLDPAVYNDGDALYVSASTPGALTNDKPDGVVSAGPPPTVEKVQKVALVTKVSSNASSNDGWAIVMGAGRVNDQNNEITRLIGRRDAPSTGSFVGTTTDTTLGTSPGAPIADNSTIYDALTNITQDLGVPDDGSVTEDKIVNSAVTTAKLADGSVTTVKLDDASVTAIKLLDGAVTTNKIAADSVTSAKLESALEVPNTKSIAWDADPTSANHLGRKSWVEAQVAGNQTNIINAYSAAIGALLPLKGSNLQIGTGVFPGFVSAFTVTNAGNVTLNGTVDGRDVATDGTNQDTLQTLTGVTAGSANLGTFTGTTIANNETVKGALQDLETALEDRPYVLDRQRGNPYFTQSTTTLTEYYTVDIPGGALDNKSLRIFMHGTWRNFSGANQNNQLAIYINGTLYHNSAASVVNNTNKAVWRAEIEISKSATDTLFLSGQWRQSTQNTNIGGWGFLSRDGVIGKDAISESTSVDLTLSLRQRWQSSATNSDFQLYAITAEMV